ncbi:MBL fold metallo-hydrolase [Thioalkalivibrio denitrificans]|uniref:MBL fold metallo-hydrolase n=1 Tax=Thioalkalivibrio denitrificans TaxID=108003 RepID=A0A1V3NRC1_9GAMM|nr:MBL fold metallo-hydrolase [Thioalkalivibrio denitrificans]OOG27554.1 MBL fold metallo-hydrolase [Thioalkalivibrio denitrificans]
MIFERFIDPGLSQHSFVVGCQGTGELAVIDPRRDVDIYLDYATENGYRITHVMDTHIHADFVSGARELAAKTGARLMVSGHDEGEHFQVGYAHEDLYDGDTIRIGNVRLDVRHVPGHTPEHLMFVVYDGARSDDVPMALLTGDFLFVGSLGRPDLLGEEAKDALARQMFRSVREKLADLPDGVEVHPGHGAGSACGAGMFGRPVSTLGYERRTNPYLDPSLDEEAFVRRLLEGLPDIPDFYPRNKRINSEGPGDVLPLPGMKALDPAGVARRARAGEITVIDLRDPLAFGGGHIPNALGIGIRGAFANWAGWVTPDDTPIVLVDADGDPDTIECAVRSLIRTGRDYIEGYVKGGMDEYVLAGLPLETLAQMDVHRAQDAVASGDLKLIDVRTGDEFESGHGDGAVHTPVAQTRDGVPAIDPDTPVAAVCGSGYRSTVAGSILKRRGYRRVHNVVGGMMAWQLQNL